MNFRVVIFSGIVAAFIGAMIGVALAHISQRELRKQAILVGGASLGFVVGATSSMIMQQKQERSEDYGEIDRLK
ncbi:hypothetical protein C7H19_00715 [Aphanothece hegewaldii CCALA 016]|uniref:Uncharacterized protein n=1 Tax=Aphanothece hegewaldii CCALA 016 TaxID=2107694 RepID=A0A2T1M3C2_9CHRO|nr:hypothetical protein [Aphanothece hegewaldii]PSF39343.1 hypothetical protein C7H19_00715 [Aphanothece hegewaldii CCALA 016]